MCRRSSAETSRTKRRLEEAQPWHRAAARSRAAIGTISWSLASELVALDETLQPESSVRDRRYTMYGLGHMQQVRLHTPRNVVPKEYCGGPKLGQCNIVFL
jgi:hypothetical protein